MLTEVRYMSSGRSMASIEPTITFTSGPRRPIASSTMKITTSPAEGTAAAPIDARRAVNTTIACCMIVKSNPRACAMKSAPAHSKTAVPSILTVAPIGKVKDAILLDTPTFSSTTFMVTGKVAPEELVEKAISSGSRMLAKWIRGEIRPRTISRIGRVTRKWIVTPDPMVSTYSASGRKASKPVVATMRVINANTPIGRNLMMPDVRFIIAWKSASKNSTSGFRVLSGSVVSAAPKTMQKKISASISAPAAAWMTFCGTMSRRSWIGESGVDSSGSACWSVPVRLAPTPGRMRLTIISPTKAAKKLEST